MTNYSLCVCTYLIFGVKLWDCFSQPLFKMKCLPILFTVNSAVLCQSKNCSLLLLLFDCRKDRVVLSRGYKIISHTAGLHHKYASFLSSPLKQKILNSAAPSGRTVNGPYCFNVMFIPRVKNCKDITFHRSCVVRKLFLPMHKQRHRSASQ